MKGGDRKLCDKKVGDRKGRDGIGGGWVKIIKETEILLRICYEKKRESTSVKIDI